MYTAFVPIAGDRADILILGTFPSPLSRSGSEYYGNPRNAFWRILFDCLDLPFDSPTYAHKCAIAVSHGIAIWDTVVSCYIEGALDSDIKNATHNSDIAELIVRLGVQRVLFNGSYAEKFYHRANCVVEGVEYRRMPSTSPANARMSYADKLSVWRNALDFLRR